MAANTSDTKHYSLSQLGITDRDLFDRLNWFTHVRWAFGLFCLLFLLISWHVFGVRFRVAEGPATMRPAALVVLVIFFYNAVSSFLLRVLRASQRITRRLIQSFALTQIGFDLVAICILIHYTGGAENSFFILILIPIVIVTELLPASLAYAAAAGAALLVNALAWGEQQGWIPHVQGQLLQNGDIQPVTTLFNDWFYVLHVTVALTVSLFAMVFFTSTITSRLRAREAELETAYDRLRQADEAKSFFMRRAEHEMRAPLAAIHSILEAIKEMVEDPTGQSERLIERAKNRTHGLIEMVRDLQRYSRLRAPEGAIDRGRLDFAAIVTNTTELLRKQAEAGDIKLSIGASAAQLTGNKEMLGELVTNLVANAIQYTPPGGQIDVELDVKDGQAIFAVADTGIGISPMAMRKIFQEFYRASQAKEFFHDGTGLGLAIVQRIVELHGGAMDVSPRTKGGTRFVVTLPLG